MGCERMAKRSDWQRLYALQDPAIEREAHFLMCQGQSLFLQTIFATFCGAVILSVLKIAGMSGFLTAFIAGVVTGFSPCLLSLWRRQRREAALYELLASRGCCTGCGYQLYGCNSGRCPECGQPFDPKAVGGPDNDSQPPPL